MIHLRLIARAIFAVVLCLLIAPAALFAAEKSEVGFASLFNGRNLDGWHLMNGAKFVVKDGVIIGLQGEDGSHEYRNIRIK